jgi:hypothetical protein
MVSGAGEDLFRPLFPHLSACAGCCSFWRRHLWSSYVLGIAETIVASSRRYYWLPLRHCLGIVLSRSISEIVTLVLAFAEDFWVNLAKM